MTQIGSKRAVILVDDQYEDLEVWYPRLRLMEARVQVIIAGLHSKKDYVGKRGYPVVADVTIDEASNERWDLVVIPGGWAPDKLRMSRAVKTLVQQHFTAARPIACICHGGWVLASAGILQGSKVTAYEAIWDDLRNAGATVVDEEVVVWKNIVTSRKPMDLPAFMRETLRLLESRPAEVNA